MSDREESIDAQGTPGVAAQRQFDESLQRQNAANESREIEDTQLGDPDPPDEGATQEVMSAYKQDVHQYSDEMLQCLTKLAIWGEDLWVEFTCTFRSSTIRAMNSSQQAAWVRFLMDNGVHVTKRRGFARWRALIECLSSREFVPVSHTGAIDVPEGMRGGTERQTAIAQVLTRPTREIDNHVEFSPDNTVVERGRRVESVMHPGNRAVTVRRDNHRDSGAHAISRHSPKSRNEFDSRDTDDSGRFNKNGIGSLMKAYTHRTKFSGSFTDDFDGAVKQYETLASVCDLSEADMAKGFPIMLSGAAFSHYTQTYSGRGHTYKQLVDEFRSWYTSEEQRYRLLQIWQRPSLTTAMQRSPEKSEIEVFHDVAQELTKVQHQLHNEYHLPRFLRDQLLVAADIPFLRRSLIEKLPATAQEAMQRIATLLSSEPRSAGAHVLEENDDQANYGLGRRFGGQARKKLKGSMNRKGSKSLRQVIASMKGCFVCGKSHMARGNHARQDIVKALDRIKKENSNVLFTVDDIDDIQYAFTTTQDDESENSESETDAEDDVNFVNSSEDHEIEQATEVYLANTSFMHGRTFCKDLDKDMLAMHAALSSGEEPTFKGILIDTGANRVSAISLEQYKAYCRGFNVAMKIDYKDNRGLSGIGGISGAIGTATIPIPFRDLGIVIDVKFRILRQKCPTLLCLRDMIQNKLDISLQDKTVMYKHKIQDLFFENDFLVHKWHPQDVDFLLYTDGELRRLHRVFGHPTVSALQKLLKRAQPEQCDKDVRSAIEDIARSCKTCSKFSSKPRRFKLSVGTEDLRFNHIVAIDLMTLAGKTVLHAVDEATHYTAATFLKSHRSEDTWKALLRCWSRVYLGPPDHLRVDQGSNFVSKWFKECAEADGITLLEAPIESPSTMSHVERYHAPLRAAFTKLRDSLPRKETDTDCLQMALKAVNDTIGPEGLCPTLLVFGAIPRPAKRTPAETQLERARAMDSAMDAVRKEQAKRKISFALRHPSSPKGKEQEEELMKLPSGAPVLVYRQKSKSWEGPFPMVHVDGGTVVVQLPSGRKIFRSTVVKSAIGTKAKDIRNADSTVDIACRFVDTEEAPSRNVLCAMFGTEVDTDLVYMTPNAEHPFKESRAAEFKGLIDRETFEVVKRSTVPRGARIYGTRWVDTLKTVDGKTFEKSRLVAQNYRDKGASHIATKSPTVSRMSQRIAIATAAMFPEHRSYVRDISQAYLQSDSSLERAIFLEAPKDFGLSDDEVLLAKKPLYGIPESGLHWFLTYHTHHVESLDMKSATGDICLLYRNRDGNCEGITILQVDDSYGHGSEEFLEDEERESQRFKSKPRKLLKADEPTDFNGARISVRSQGVHVLNQSEKLRKVTKPETQSDLVSTRAQLQYIGSCTRPDLCAAVQLMASDVTNPTKATYKKMNDIVRWSHETCDIGLTYVPLDRDTLRLVLFTDASFANAGKLQSQIGFVVVLVDANNRGNILHYGSSRCKRVTRSVMAAELHALVYGFDNAYVVRDILEEILLTKIEIDGYVDSRTVFNVVAKNSSTLEKRLQIDVHALRESHARGELQYLAWIPGTQNIADALTKGLIDSSHPLWHLMQTNEINLQPQGWVDGSRFERS